jgi:hypothetical protein
MRRDDQTATMWTMTWMKKMNQTNVVDDGGFEICRDNAMELEVNSAV